MSRKIILSFAAAATIAVAIPCLSVSRRQGFRRWLVAAAPFGGGGGFGGGGTSHAPASPATAAVR